MKFNILSEEELVQEALNGSEAHLNLLISMYEPFIVEHIGKQIKNQQDLLDLRQHICCRIVKQISNKNYVHQDKFSSWTTSIIKNEVNNYFRKKKRSTVLQYSSADFLDEFTAEFLSEFTDESLMAAEETLTLMPNLLAYLEQLPDEQAIVIDLKCFHNKTFREISELINVPINTVMGRYRYGIERIREMMAK